MNVAYTVYFRIQEGVVRKKIRFQKTNSALAGSLTQIPSPEIPKD